MTPKPHRSDGWDLLGGVRFGLAAVVLASHLAESPLTGRSPALLHLAAFGDVGGFPAVLGFLFLSGYAIAHSISRRSEGFYARRFERIYPLYAGAVAAGVAADVLTGAYGRHEAKTVIANLVFLQTFRTHPIQGNGALWTLGVEVAFYAAAPLLLRLRTAALLALIAVSAAAYACFPRLGLDYFGNLLHGLPVLFLGWSWLAGFAFYRYRDRPGAAGLLVAGTLALTHVSRTYTSGHSTILIFTTLATLAVVGTGRVRLPTGARRVAAYAGDLSYPLYLFQGPILVMYCSISRGQSYWAIVALAVATAAVAVALDRAMNRPVTAGVNRLFQLGRSVARRTRTWRAVGRPASLTGGPGHVAGDAAPSSRPQQ